MRWRGRRQSTNVRDTRGRGGGLAIGGIGGVLLLLAGWYFGVDLTPLLSGSAPAGGPTETTPTPESDERAAFVRVVLADTEDVWNRLFASQGQDYAEPTLTMFDQPVRSACGTAQSAIGPFYCPGDHGVYIDLGFFTQLAQRLGAPGDFAQAYVIAHEVGHHVQTLLGISERVHAQRRRLSAAEANALSVRMELQADCLAGVWAYHAQRSKQILEPGDVEEALGAASAIGDDTLQRQSTGQVVPESFTHGTSAQRVSWFRRGFESGSMEQCDTFSSSL